MTDLIDDLNRRAREAGDPTARDVTESAIAAALADDRERAWGLLHLAGAFRDAGDHEQALEILDHVWLRFENANVRRASLTCAIATHMDRGDTPTANALCDEQRVWGSIDVKFLRAELRARTAWLDETGEEVALIARDLAAAELEVHEAVAPA
jgi:hypothetical protein